MDTLALSIVTPQRNLLETHVQWVDLPAESGAMRVLPHHAPTLGLLGAGLVRYASTDGREQMLAVRGGFLEVLGDRVELLADVAELPAHIDAARARAEWEKLRNQPIETAADEDAARARLQERQYAEARAQAAGAA